MSKLEPKYILYSIEVKSSILNQFADKQEMKQQHTAVGWGSVWILLFSTHSFMHIFFIHQSHKNQLSLQQIYPRKTKGEHKLASQLGTIFISREASWNLTKHNQNEKIIIYLLDLTQHNQTDTNTLQKNWKLSKCFVLVFVKITF